MSASFQNQHENIVYLYDGSFEGLLYAVAIAVKSQQQIQAVYDINHYRPQLFDNSLQITTDSIQAAKLMRFLYGLHPMAAELFVSGYLSEKYTIGSHLISLVRECVQHGVRALDQYSQDSIRYLLVLRKRIHKEVHRYNGLLRFYRMENLILYAPFAPEFNIIGYSARHFRQRISSEKWILHDLLRDSALFWDCKTLQQIEIEQDFYQYVRRYGKPPKEKTAKDEKKYQQLWQSFHHSINNKQRENRKLQKKYIPQRYWKYLVEKR